MPDTPLGYAASASIDPDLSFALWCESKRTWILTLVAVAAIGFTLLYFSFTADDAFISFRYGKNLVQHHVWNWNANGTREEAYTSAVYTVLAVLPFLLHLPIVLFMKLVGLACLGRMVYRLCQLASSRFAKLLGIVLLACSPVVWVHTYSCLETPLYMCLILEMAIAAMRATETSPIWAYTLFLLLPLTRPEGLVFACAGMALYWKFRGTLPKQLALFGLSLLLGAVYFVARAHYFHNLLPNPFYVKVAQQPLRDLLGELAVNLAAYKGYVFALLLVCVFARHRITRTMALSSLLLMVLLFAPHLMAMNYADRFYVQITLPVLLIFLVLEDVPSISRVAVMITALFAFAFSPADMLRQLKYPANIARAHFDIGHRLKPFSAGHTLIAGDVGGIPFYSNWFSYDFVGLATNSIARSGVTVASLQAMHPDLIILYNEKAGPGLLTDGSWVGDPERTGKALVQYINDSGQFEYAGSAKSNGFYLVEFLRKDTPQHDAVLSALRANSSATVQEPTLKNILMQRYLPSSY